MDPFTYLNSELSFLAHSPRLPILFSLYTSQKSAKELSKELTLSEKEIQQELTLLENERLITALPNQTYQLSYSGDNTNMRTFIEGLEALFDHFLYHYTH